MKTKLLLVSIAIATIGLSQQLNNNHSMLYYSNNSAKDPIIVNLKNGTASVLRDSTFLDIQISNSDSTSKTDVSVFDLYGDIIQYFQSATTSISLLEVARGTYFITTNMTT